ncbi:MAG: isopentenyl-diphosphate delta-isomerase, partial [Saprospiraceae bacterium]|nr:isopentenyl-diphosphate delta-isomerase [Saprospiraceae bacterium]
LGSCRQLLYEDTRLHEFDVRQFMPDQPICINLGIAQIEEMIDSKEIYQIHILAEKLKADGLIVHINPLQEWLQPEGDLIKRPPIETLHTLLDVIQIPVIVKEVGQGFGLESLKALLALPIAAVDLAGFGGTNFSKLELMRSDEIRYNSYKDLFNIGHACGEMVEWINAIKEETPENIRCEQIIFSGGIKNFLDGYYFIKKCKHPSFYAQASGFLKYAMDIEDLRKHATLQIEGYKLANAMLTIKQ